MQAPPLLPLVTLVTPGRAGLTPSVCGPCSSPPTTMQPGLLLVSQKPQSLVSHSIVGDSIHYVLIQVSPLCRLEALLVRGRRFISISPCRLPVCVCGVFAICGGRQRCSHAPLTAATPPRGRPRGRRCAHCVRLPLPSLLAAAQVCVCVCGGREREGFNFPFSLCSKPHPFTMKLPLAEENPLITANNEYRAYLDNAS